MNMNDPFGRLAQQQGQEYTALRQSLEESGVNSQAKAEALLANIRKRALVIASLVALLAAVTALVMPQFAVLAAVSAALPLLWLFATTVKGQRLIRRYIKELNSEQT